MHQALGYRIDSGNTIVAVTGYPVRISAYVLMEDPSLLEQMGLSIIRPDVYTDSYWCDRKHRANRIERILRLRDSIVQAWGIFCHDMGLIQDGDSIPGARFLRCCGWLGYIL